MAKCFKQMRQKQGTICTLTTKLLTRIEKEVSKDEPDSDKLCEILSVLSTKDESLMDLDKSIEDETPMDELEVEITNTQEYQDCILTWKAHTTRLIQTAWESVRVQVNDSSSVRLLNNQTVKLPKLVIEKYSREIS